MPKKLLAPNAKKIIKPPLTSYLHLIALSDTSLNLEYLITAIIAKNNCNILNISMHNLDQKLAITGLISGKWNEIAKLEKSIDLLAKKNNAHIYLKRTDLNNSFKNEPYINYIVQATIINKTKTLEELLNFFYTEKIYINFINFNMNNADPILVNLEIQLKIPINLHIMSLREKFLTLCEKLNLDLSLEPCC